mgnify:CR=1 FL=1
MKVLDGVVAAVFEGTPKSPWHDIAQDGMVGADESSARVDKKYGKDSWQAQYWGATMGVTKTLLGFSDVMFGNVGGLATLGAGGALARTAQAARGTAAGTTAAATAATGEAALAVHIVGQIQLSLPSVLDTMYDPKASIKEKSEAFSGTVLAAFFAAKLGSNSAKTLQGALKSQYGVDINLETATRAELNNAGVRIVRVRENKAAKAEGREPITPKEGETLMEYATRVAAEKVKVVEGKILPKLKGEKQKTFNRIVGELQALERMRLDEPRIDKETGKEVREGIPVEETTIVEPILSERPVRPLLEAEPQPIVVPPEVLKFEPEPVDRRADAEAGREAAYYDRTTLQVRSEAEAALLEAAARDAKIAEALKAEEPAAEVDNLKGFDRADDGKVYVDRQVDFEEFPERFTGDDAVAGIELKTVTEPINEALFDPSLKKRGELERRRLEISNQQKELQAKGVFEGRIHDFPKGMMDKWTELMRDKGDALERWEADHKELYDRYYELEKQNKLLHEKFRYTSSIEEVLTRPTLESAGLVKEEPLTFDTTYHVTRTINVPSVLKEGIVSGGGKSFKPVDPSHPNYKAIMERGEVGGVGGSLGRVHSFESLNDAVAWASRMDWELNKGYGTGEISIIPIRGGKDIGWQLDPELAKSGDKGLRRFGNVLPEYLGEPVKVGKKLFDDWSKAAREDRTLKLPEPAKPAAEAAAEEVVKDAKVDEEAVMETVEVKGRMKKLVEREIAFLRREGATAEDIATARELELDNTSFYDILPSTRWADMISRLSKADVEAMEATEGFPSTLKSLTDGRKVQLNYEAYKAAEKSGNPDAPALKEEYTKSLQEWASDATELGQRIESLKHNPHITPEILVGKINQILKDSVGGKEIEGKERTELEGLVEKSMDTIKEFREAQDKFSRKPTEENFNAAFEKLQKAEAASRGQWEFMTNHSPKLWADLYVSALQGNLLTPATLVLNVGGNIVPRILRAPSRATTRALDLMHEFFTGKPARRAELRKLREEFEAMADKESPEYADIAAEIARREKEIISDTIIQPMRGSLATFKGLTKGMGLERIREALKAPKGEKWQTFKHRRYDDAISSLLFGQRANMYEVGSPERAMSPLSPLRAWKRLYRRFTTKEGKRDAGKALKDLAEGTVGVAPSMMFKALAAGDLFPRHAEFARLVENYGTRLGRSKGWGRDKTETWIERAQKAPEIMFGEKKLLELRDEASRTTFQNDTWASDLMGRLNVGLRAPKDKTFLINKARKSLGGTAKRTLYLGYRSTVPFQKTLVNIFAENLSFTPLGILDAALNPRYSTAQRKLATGRALTGTAAYIGINWLREMTGNDIISVDYSMGMTDEKRSTAYLAGEVIPDGTVNWSAWGRFLKREDTTPQKGDKVTNLKKAGPAGDIMLAVASFQDTLEKMPASKREEFGESLTNLMVGVAGQKFRFLLNQSFAQNARDFVQGMMRGDKLQEIIKPWARGAAAVAIPNTLDWLYNNSKDNPWRRKYQSDTFTDEFKLSMKKKMIAWDWITSKGEWSEKAGEQNPVIFNLWGEPVERIRRGGMLLGIKKVNPDSSFERYLHSTLGVFETGQVIPKGESKVLYWLWRDTRNSSIAPSIPRREISRDKVNYELNRDQYAVYQRLIGLRRIKGPPAPPRRARWPSGTEAVIDERWAGMTALLEEGNSYEGGNTAWVDMKQDEQVRHVLKMYSGASRSAGDYLVDNFMLKEGGPTKEDLIALAGLGEDATEKEARAVIKGFSINLDNLDKLEVTKKPSGRLKK